LIVCKKCIIVRLINKQYFIEFLLTSNPLLLENIIIVIFTVESLIQIIQLYYLLLYKQLIQNFFIDSFELRHDIIDNNFVIFREFWIILNLPTISSKKLSDKMINNLYIKKRRVEKIFCFCKLIMIIFEEFVFLLKTSEKVIIYHIDRITRRIIFN
jgi:hypothetical protein